MAFASTAGGLLLRRQYHHRAVPRAVARVLLVGSGRMGRIRADAIYSNPRLEFCGIVDPDEVSAAELGGLYGAPHYRSLSEAIADQQREQQQQQYDAHQSAQPPLDGIVVSTPTPTHERLVEEAALNGISIFAEKPIDETAHKIRALFDTARRCGVELCCGFQRRFDPSYLSLYHQVNGNTVAGLGSPAVIGTPLTASIFFGDHPVPSRTFLLQGGGNIIADCSAHDVDYVRWVLGDEVESVYATGTSSDDELRDAGVIDNATMVMKFSRGTVVTLTLSRGANYGYDQRCEVFGTRGLASVRNHHENSGEIADASGVHRPRWMHSFPQRFKAAFANEMDAFADTLLLGTAWPVKEGDCVAVQAVCDAALESCECGEVVRLGDAEGSDAGGVAVAEGI